MKPYSFISAFKGAEPPLLQESGVWTSARSSAKSGMLPVVY